MTTRERVTLSIPADLLAQAKVASAGNLSQFFVEMLQQHFEVLRLAELERSLIQGYTLHREEALTIAEEFRYADYEVTQRYIPEASEMLEVEAIHA